MHLSLEDLEHQNDEAMCYEPPEPQLHGLASDGIYTYNYKPQKISEPPIQMQFLPTRKRR